jgi:hypothetical protein
MKNGYYNNVNIISRQGEGEDGDAGMSASFGYS